MLTVDPAHRISIVEALKHPWILVREKKNLNFFFLLT